MAVLAVGLLKVVVSALFNFVQVVVFVGAEKHMRWVYTAPVVTPMAY